MTKSAIEDLYGIMHDTRLEFRHRHNAAISASRVEPLPLKPGSPEPPAVTFLRNILDPDNDHPPQFRREAGAALAYFERRHAKAAIKFNVDNSNETRDAWTRFLNAAIRQHLWKHNRWPHDKHLLIKPADIANFPPFSPDLALAAILSTHTKRTPTRRKALDQPDAVAIASPAQRRDILRTIAKTIHAHIYPEEHPTPTDTTTPQTTTQNAPKIPYSARAAPKQPKPVPSRLETWMARQRPSQRTKIP